MAAPKGNKNAAKAKAWDLALKRALARVANGTYDKGLDLIADKCVSAAVGGERWAIEQIADRMDGKAAQSIEHTGDILHRHTEELSDAALTDIATGSRSGVTEEASGETINSELH